MTKTVLNPTSPLLLCLIIKTQFYFSSFTTKILTREVTTIIHTLLLLLLPQPIENWLLPLNFIVNTCIVIIHNLLDKFKCPLISQSIRHFGCL